MVEIPCRGSDVGFPDILKGRSSNHKVCVCHRVQCSSVLKGIRIRQRICGGVSLRVNLRVWERHSVQCVVVMKGNEGRGDAVPSV